MKRRVAPRNERTEGMRGVVERLEERAMLSASYGSLAHGYGGHDFGLRGGAGAHFGDSAVVAQQQQRSMSYDTQLFYGGHEYGGSYRELQYGLPMQMAFQPSQRMRSFEQHSLRNPTWNQSFASSPPLLGYSAYSAPEPVFVVWRVYTVSTPLKSLDAQHVETTIYDNDDTSHRPPPNGPPLDYVGSIIAGIKGADRKIYLPSPGSLDLVGSTIPSGSGILGYGSTNADLSAVTQILSRESNTLATLSMIAREVAFQEFSPRLFQADATSAYDRTNLDGLVSQSTQPDMFDGFIRPTAESIAGDAVRSADAVAREREAVDAVLEELHDVNALLPATASANLTFQIDLQADAALDEMPAGEVDGGMVLLQTTGDANGSGFDLGPVYADHIERFEAPAKMETSVGMFQAVDVQADDGPVIDLAPQTESTSEQTPEIKFDQNLPPKREQSSPNKAAAIVGTTTLTGALVWLSRSGGRISKSEPAAQKRRAARN